MIVGLKRDVPSGESFEMTDIDWIKAVLHFADVSSMQIAVEALTREAKKWMMEVDNEAD